MILAGDIGGTHTRLALFREETGQLRMAADRTYPSRDHQSLEDIVSLFRRDRHENVESACFGVAGPVLDGRANISNLTWTVDATSLAKLLGLHKVWLINDLAAHASGIDGLQPADLIPLNPGEPVEGNAALIAPGTGLGEAGLFWNGTRRVPFASEGGHADFAPRNDLEISLQKYLRAKFGRVSYERILSGPGVKNIYDFLRDSGLEQEPASLRDELLQAEDPQAIISHHGISGDNAICERAIRIFVGVFGAEAGNLALRFLAVSGVYLSGGVSVKILPKLQEPLFMQAFLEKGRLSPLLQKVPVNVVRNEAVGLIGAAHYAWLNQTSQAQATRSAGTES
jgi:glucokinase